MDLAVYEILRQALRLVMLASVPIVIGVSVAGIVSGALQMVTGVSDWSIGYVARLVGVGIALSLCLQGFVRELLPFAQSFFGAGTL
jgi:type III secretory pathway component EscS